jgi:hypothetical protein
MTGITSKLFQGVQSNKELKNYSLGITSTKKIIRQILIAIRITKYIITTYFEENSSTPTLRINLNEHRILLIIDMTKYKKSIAKSYF